VGAQDDHAKRKKKKRKRKDDSREREGEGKVYSLAGLSREWEKKREKKTYWTLKGDL